MPGERLHGVHDLRVHFRFVQVSSCACMKSFRDRFITLVHREHEDFCDRRASTNLARGIDPIEHWKPQIKHCNVRRVLDGEINSSTPICGLGTHNEIVAGLK